MEPPDRHCKMCQGLATTAAHPLLSKFFSRNAFLPSTVFKERSEGGLQGTGQDDASST